MVVSREGQTMALDPMAIPQTIALEWDTAEREARRAAAFVAAFVGVPAAIAAAAVLALFAITFLVLLAPLAALVLTWVAWRYGKAEPPPGAGAGATRDRSAA